MRALVTLSVLQAIGIAALIVHAFREERPPPPELRPSQTASRLEITPSADIASGNYERRLRAIIREELTRLESRPSAPSQPPAAAAAARGPAPDPYRREVVAQQIETYRAIGSITDTQMQELQADIARLDDASRKQLMSKLMRALNSGDIKGRL